MIMTHAAVNFELICKHMIDNIEKEQLLKLRGLLSIVSYDRVKMLLQNLTPHML